MPDRVDVVVQTSWSTRLDPVATLCSHLPDCRPRHILVKPNWVRHQESGDFPITALVTDTGLLDAIMEACVRRYPGVERITVGDVPLQDCDWDLLSQQAGLAALAAKWSSRAKPEVIVRDLRRERYRSERGYLECVHGGDHGDPLGYVEVDVGAASLLDAIADAAASFAVSDYRRETTAAAHRAGSHRYLVAASALDADLVINVPKMKTHQKAGITGALKNLVGINGDKGRLVHYRRGIPRNGGDEFAPETKRLIRL